MQSNISSVTEIDKINFGILSPNEILQMSVCEISSTSLSGIGSVYDARMGFSSDNDKKKCVTCNLDYERCTGHYGHITLPEPIFHPNLKIFKQISMILHCFCFKCGKILVSHDQLEINGFLKSKRNARFLKIVDKLKKDAVCISPDCGIVQPKIVADVKERAFKVVHKIESNIIDIPITHRDIYKILDNISDDDVRLLGFNPELIHPRNMMIIVLPVIPPCSRPTVVIDSTICDDDLTTKYVEIYKCVKKYNENQRDDTEKTRLQRSIEFHVSTLFDNSKNLSKHSTNMKPTSSFRDRMSGKNALIRANLMGKRCNQTARTVIGPDPTLRLGQLAIPFEIACNLTIPERVTTFNKDYLLKLVNSGKANYITKNGSNTRINLEYALYKRGTKLMFGDVIIRGTSKIYNISNNHPILKKGDKIKRGDELIPVILTEKRCVTLDIGDVVDRQLRNGDIVLLNRQPTLHKGSMMAKEILIKPYKTMRFNLATTKSFNADFDGDEMNIHVGQTLESRAELLTLSATKYNLISSQSSKPNIVIVQDSLLGVFKMTHASVKMTKSQFYNIINCIITNDGLPMSCNEILHRIKHISNVLKSKNIDDYPFTGKGIFSFCLPLDFNYMHKNNANTAEPIVKICNGVLYDGVINKVDVGGSANSIIQCLYKEYDRDVACTFIDNVQFVTNKWLDLAGFTVGIKDCVASKTDEISNAVEKCFIEACTISTTTLHKGVREVRINAALSKARDIGLKMAKENMSHENGFASTVMAGSKGDFFNIAQITGLLGQQNINGCRIPMHLNNGTRTLPHYSKSKQSVDLEFESRGFIRNSFIHGLNPKEFYLHAMTGRTGIIDTSMGTARSGYIQRRIVKIAEDIAVKYDGTVRNLDNNIYEFAYADCGLDPTELVVKNDEYMICNVERMVDRLNVNVQQ